MKVRMPHGLVMVASHGNYAKPAQGARIIDAYFQQTGASTFGGIESRVPLRQPGEHYRHLRPDVAGTIRQMEYFLKETGRLEPTPTQPKTPVDTELDLFSDHLRRVRGLEFSTIRSHERVPQGVPGAHRSTMKIDEALAVLTIRDHRGFYSGLLKKIEPVFSTACHWVSEGFSAFSI